MEMRIHIVGIGIGVGGTGVGLSFAKAAHLYMRHGKDDAARSLHIYDHFHVGSGGPNLVVTALQTEWFPVNLAKHDWLHRKAALIGKTGKVQVDGTTLLGGYQKVSVTFLILDRFAETEHSLTAHRIPVESGSLQVGSTKVWGTIRSQPLRGVDKELSKAS